MSGQGLRWGVRARACLALQCLQVTAVGVLHAMSVGFQAHDCMQQPACQLNNSKHEGKQRTVGDQCCCCCRVALQAWKRQQEREELLKQEASFGKVSTATRMHTPRANTPAHMHVHTDITAPRNSNQVLGMSASNPSVHNSQPSSASLTRLNNSLSRPGCSSHGVHRQCSK